MYFRLKSIVAVTLLATSLLGCVGEDETRNRIRDLKVGKKKGPHSQLCLEDFGGTMAHFVKSEISREELAGFFSCIDGALDLFSSFVKGSHPEGYTCGELRDYLQTYFMKDSVISDELLSGVMSLKKLFVGGSDKILAKSEIGEARRFVGLLGDIGERARPYMKIYFSGIGKGASIQGMSEDRIITSLSVLGGISQDLARWLTKKKSNYITSDFASFLKALRASMVVEDRHTLDDIIKMVPLANSAKVILIGGRSEEIKSDQWNQFFKVLHNAFAILVRFNYSIKGNSDWLRTSQFLHLNEIVSIVVSLIREGQAVHQDQIIPHGEIADVLTSVGEMVTFPLGLKSSAILRLWEALVDYGLTPYEGGARQAQLIPGLGPAQLETLGFEFQYWFEAQVYLNDLLKAKMGWVRPPLTPLKEQDRLKAIHEMKRVISGKIPLLLDDQNRVLIDYGVGRKIYDHKSLFVLNWQRATIRLLIKGFSDNPRFRNEIIGLTRKDLEVAARSLKDLLVALGIAKAHETSEVISKNIFQLASLFMPSSKGQAVLSLEEGVEYFSMVLSGVNSGLPLVKWAKKHCLTGVGDDGKDLFDVHCYRKQFVDNFGSLVSHLPNMVKYVEELNPRSQSQFQRSLEEATRARGYSPHDISASEINKVFVVLYYVEIFMARFDKNQDGIINKKEGLVGFPVFKNVLAQLLYDQTGKRSDKLTKGLYAWLLDKGRAPLEDESFSFGWWSYTKWGWGDIRADRTRLAEILATLSASNRKN